MIKIFKQKYILIILFLAFLLTNQMVLAQSSVNSRVYFEGLTTLAPGSEFIVSVLVDAGESINAFDLEIIYPKDKLEFLNFDNTGSIVNIWQPTPTILPNGNLGFSGGIIKAWNSKGGLLIKLSFKALSSGEAKLSFAKNNLYKADGKATEIKAPVNSLTISIKDNAKVISSPIVPFEPTLENIIIEKELENFEKEMFWDKMLTPVLILGAILFVILSFAVYNNRKRKL